MFCVEMKVMCVYYTWTSFLCVDHNINFISEIVLGLGDMKPKKEYNYANLPSHGIWINAQHSCRLVPVGFF